MKFPVLLTVWIICDIYLSASAQTSKDEQTVSPVQLKEVPACRSQDIPPGVQEVAITAEFSCHLRVVVWKQCKLSIYYMIFEYNSSLYS